jgi:hypothetical protein
MGGVINTRLSHASNAHHETYRAAMIQTIPTQERPFLLQIEGIIAVMDRNPVEPTFLQAFCLISKGKHSFDC